MDKPEAILDTHFNRSWDGRFHRYLDNTGQRDKGSVIHQGWVKVKLVHGRAEGLGHYSLIVPDLILLEGTSLSWIQPLHFLANSLYKDAGDITASLPVDISCGQTVLVTFKASAFAASYEDGSELYRCEIEGPNNLSEYTTGPAKWTTGGRLMIQVFHHTSEQARADILACRYLNPSTWNIQSTKRLKNVGYVYFTCLPHVDCEGCLLAIAMASEGRIELRFDLSPDSAASENIQILPQRNTEALSLDVRRENTSNRTAALAFWIDPGRASPQHLLRHYNGRLFWYEVISAFTVRVGVEPGKKLRFSRESGECICDSAKVFDYCIVGNAWESDGLAAPFDEEETPCVFKIERPGPGSNILRFWFEHANSLRYTELNPAPMEFERRPAGDSDASAGAVSEEE